MTDKINEFVRIETESGGRHKFTLCPHIADAGRPDSSTSFINLVDVPGRTVTLVLCGVCSNVVSGALIGEHIQKTVIDGVKMAIANAKVGNHD